MIPHQFLADLEILVGSPGVLGVTTSGAARLSGGTLSITLRMVVAGTQKYRQIRR